MSRAATVETPLQPSSFETERPKVTAALLADIARRIMEAFHPDKVILFGSYAYGKPHKDSDIDLLVILDTEDSVHDRMRKVYAAAKIPSLPMDVIVRTPQEIRKRLGMRDPFILEILQKGRTLYQQDEKDYLAEKVEESEPMALRDEWVEKAEGDFNAAKALNRQRKIPQPDGVCYHAQQCAEKYLKAYLVMHNETPKRTHDLNELLKQCLPYDAGLSVLTPQLLLLNPYSTRFRYPGNSAVPADAQAALTMVRTLRRTLRRKMGL